MFLPQSAYFCTVELILFLTIKETQNVNNPYNINHLLWFFLLSSNILATQYKTLRNASEQSYLQLKFSPGKQNSVQAPAILQSNLWLTDLFHRFCLGWEAKQWLLNTLQRLILTLGKVMPWLIAIKFANSRQRPKENLNTVSLSCISSFTLLSI